MTVEQHRLLYVVGAQTGAAAIAPALAQLRGQLPHARHALVQASSETAAVELRAELRLPTPDYFLDVGPGSPVAQTTTAMERIERVIELERPDLVMLADDSAATLSAALTALKLSIPTARLDAGLRNFDRQTPEEINRVIMDTFADLLFASREQEAVNLRAEGIEPGRVHLIGSTTADTLADLEPRYRAALAARRLGLPEDGYLLALLRESTLADRVRLRPLLDHLSQLGMKMPVVLPAPATAPQGWTSSLGGSGVRVVRPIDYVDRLSLVRTAAAVVTDSGSVRDETTFMDIACLTLGNRTERMQSHSGRDDVGAGKTVPSMNQIQQAIERTRRQPPGRPTLWDGQASARLAQVVATHLSPGGGTASRWSPKKPIQPRHKAPQ